jgi:hypothetical protein
VNGPIRVRMGIHTGEPAVTSEGYVGIDVHRAARIAAAGHGGQVLLSRSTRDLVAAGDVRDLGEHRLKDLSAPERLFQLGDEQFPPLLGLEVLRSSMQSHARLVVGRAGAPYNERTKISSNAATSAIPARGSRPGMAVTSCAATSGPRRVRELGPAAWYRRCGSWA